MEKGEKMSEWARCSEGFSDIKNYGTATSKSRKKKGCDTLKYRTLRTASLDAEIKSQEILWSSSDSEDGTVSEIYLGKRKKTVKRSSPSKRKSIQGSQMPSSSETVDIVASDSDSEKVTPESTKNSGSVKTQEGSIQGYESASDDENDHTHTAKQLSQAARDADTTDSPSISGSTQSVSPPPTNTGSGVKASDWVKSLQLKTPSKSEYQGETTTAEDSAKKKKKHSRGGLAEQLSRLQAREKSAVRMWSHQQNKAASSSQDSSKTVCLRVLGFEVLYSMQVVKCAVLLNREETETKLVMFPVSQSEQLNLQVGTEVTVYPPWQQLEMNDGQAIMLCTRFCQVTVQPEEDSGRENCCLSEGRKSMVTAAWNCPCVQGLCKLQSQCPAFKFPSVPGLLISKNTPSPCSSDSVSENNRIVSPEKHLHTVAEKVKDVTNISDSLLESIERSSERVDKLDGGPTSINFKGTVHRVNSSGTENNRLLLLVEDGHGAVCEIQMLQSTLEEAGFRSDIIEGKSFQFTRLHVLCRKTRDKDPSLFSLIDSVWSGTRGAISSQDSENSTHDNDHRSSPVEPPSFCYVLTCDENENVSIKPCTVSVVHSKPVTFMQLIVIKTEMNSRRCSCNGRTVYMHSSSNVPSTSQSEPILYLTDPSLQKLVQPYTKCHVTANCHNSLPLLRDSQGHILQLKDALTDHGELVADTYTNLLPLSAEEENNQETWKLHEFKLPLLHDTIKKLDLCSVSGIITEVDEDSAYSWEACNYCSSDQLLSQPTESGDNAGNVRCKNCQKIVTSPDTKMKMEILVKCNHMLNIDVRVDLLQSTIETLLPSNEEADEGYELSFVLNKSVGPLNCVVIDYTETNRHKQLSLREIQLFL